MIRVFIDGREADTDQETGVAITLSADSLTDMDKARAGYTKVLNVPVTERNRDLTGDVEEIAGIAFFNQADHTVRIEADGCVVAEGMLYLERVERTPGGAGRYRFCLLDAGKLWAKGAAERMLRALGIDFRVEITAETVKNSWTWNQPVRFLPVQRDKQLVENPYANLFPPARVLTFEDYHPFLHVRSMIEAIMAESGYRIESEFLSSDYFDSLYISGNYPTHDVETIKNKMDFLAGRFEDREAEANQFGYVYANPFTIYNTIGNLVDTADPKEENNGQVIADVFTAGNYFQMEEGRIAFIPPQEVMVGFEYRIFYTTDYYMLNREELKCFNRINLQEEEFRRFRVVNRNVDRRTQYKANKNFRLVVFGHVAGNTYQLRHDRITNTAADAENLQPEDYVTETVATFTTRTESVYTSTTSRLANPALFVKPAGSGAYQPYAGDWALYDGYVEEYGSVDVDLTVRSAPERLLPSEPKYFNRIVFGGANPGMKLKISKLTRIRPVFYLHPTEGTTVEFADLAAHRIRQIDFVDAIRHLFDLHFQTDPVGKVVRIEPAGTFYRTDVVVDWSDRIDREQPVCVEELGAELYRTMTYGYQDGDGAVARYNEANGGHYGDWNAEIANRMAKTGEKNVRNPLFAPSLALQEVYPDAKNARLLQAGDRDRSGESSENLNFTAKIVHYNGMKALPDNQYWGWPGYEGSYPDLSFHADGLSEGDGSPGSGRTLCFGDEDGRNGLHRFYDRRIRQLNEAKRLTVWLRLQPQDVEPVVMPNRLGRDFRALFRLRIDGEDGWYRLEKIIDYDPAAKKSTQCVFVKEVR